MTRYGGLLLPRNFIKVCWGNAKGYQAFKNPEEGILVTHVAHSGTLREIGGLPQDICEMERYEGFLSKAYANPLPRIGIIR
ncbi:MAG: hypothetical protein HGA85_09260 [Nanoarchaeota archaeon]|nr:hypothetical protein [Nanoarchaeota archaeon]